MIDFLRGGCKSGKNITKILQFARVFGEKSPTSKGDGGLKNSSGHLICERCLRQKKFLKNEFSQDFCNPKQLNQFYHFFTFDEFYHLKFAQHFNMFINI